MNDRGKEERIKEKVKENSNILDETKFLKLFF